MNEFTTFANRDVNNLTLVDYKTDKEFLYFKYANTTTTDVSGTAVYAYGGQGHPIKVVFNGEKTGTFKIETQLQSAKLYSLITGADIQKTATWLKREEIVADTDGTLTISATPIAGTVNVYTLDDDCGTVIVGSVVDTTITSEEIKANTTYVVYYQTNLENVQNIALKSTTFPKAFKIYGETWDKTEDDEIIAQKLIIYKAQLQDSFSVSHANSGDPATITITFDLLADKNDNMLDLIFEEDAA